VQWLPTESASFTQAISCGAMTPPTLHVLWFMRVWWHCRCECREATEHNGDADDESMSRLSQALWPWQEAPPGGHLWTWAMSLLHVQQWPVPSMFW